MTTNNSQDRHRDHDIIHEDLRGTRGMEKLAELSGEMNVLATLTEEGKLGHTMQ